MFGIEFCITAVLLLTLMGFVLLHRSSPQPSTP